MASLIGQNSGIIVNGAYGIELYIKGSTDYYRIVCLYVPSVDDIYTSRFYSTNETEYQNRFNFILTPVSGAGAATPPSQLSYDDLFNPSDIENIFSGSEVYIRNDSNLHKYLINNDIDYINIYKPYVYLGKLYPADASDSMISIETYGMKDYVLDALPVHQRTNNIREFLGVSFDQLYPEIYLKIRGLLSMQDPHEVPDQYLKYILDMYNMTSIMPSGSVDYTTDRFYAENLPDLLKRKGTYNALEIIYRILTSSSNIFSIYEQWHGVIPEEAPGDYSSIRNYCEGEGYEWQEHRYNDYYGTTPPSTGAGTRYYTNEDSYPTSESDLVLSPHYRTEIDLSTEPLETLSIAPSGLLSTIRDKFEEIRPVSRFVEYSELISLPSDFTGGQLNTYVGEYVHAKTRCIQPIYGFADAYVHHSTVTYEDGTIIIGHYLDSSDIIVQCYKVIEGDVFELFYPKYINILDGNLILVGLNFKEDTEIYVFIANTKASVLGDVSTYKEINPPDYSTTTITEFGNITSVYKLDSTRFEILPARHLIPTSTEHIIDVSESTTPIALYEINLDAIDFSAVFNGVDLGTITHSLGTKGILIDIGEYSVIDGISTKIMPKSIKIIDDNSISIEVDDESKQYLVSIRKIARSSNLYTKEALFESISTIKIGEGASTITYTPVSGYLQDEIDSSKYEVVGFYKYYPTPTYETNNIKVIIKVKENINITEAGLYDTEGNLVFYTTCSNISVLEGMYLIFYYKIIGDIN